MAFASLVMAALLGPTMIDSTGFVELTPAQMEKREMEGRLIYSAYLKSENPIYEVIPSWEAQMPHGTKLEFEFSVPSENPRWYKVGTWAVDQNRSSTNDQSDETAAVFTDTFRCQTVSSVISLRITASPNELGELPILEVARLIVTSKESKWQERSPNVAAWGRILEPPRRAQMSYENGGVLCSPTSVSMQLGYWAQTQNRAEWDDDVPVVQAGVYDPGWEGTGNWSFNMAYAASKPGLTAFVSRFRDIRDIEEWIEAGVPISTSVSYDYLKGKPERSGKDGHLVVLVGFDENGNPVFNDPGRNVVRMTYERAAFDRAWASSGRAVYVVYPDSWPIPATLGPWPRNGK